jgi:hypothetical protein
MMGERGVKRARRGHGGALDRRLVRPPKQQKPISFPVSASARSPHRTRAPTLAGTKAWSVSCQRARMEEQTRGATGRQRAPKNEPEGSKKKSARFSAQGRQAHFPLVICSYSPSSTMAALAARPSAMVASVWSGCGVRGVVCGARVEKNAKVAPRHCRHPVALFRNTRSPFLFSRVSPSIPWARPPVSRSSKMPRLLRALILAGLAALLLAGGLGEFSEWREKRVLRSGQRAVGLPAPF